VYYDQMIKLKF